MVQLLTIEYFFNDCLPYKLITYIALTKIKCDFQGFLLTYE